MQTVQPIRDRTKLQEMAQFLRNWKERNFVMFMTGIGSAYRITDMLSLQAGDIRERDFFILTEGKTGKQRRMKMDPDLRKLLHEYIKDMPDDEYLFKSREGKNKPMSRTMAYLIIKKAAAAIGLKEQIGCHTMRKTFGYHHYQRFKDAVLLMQLFGHSREDITLRYIGVTQDMIDHSVDRLRMLKGIIPERKATI